MTNDISKLAQWFVIAIIKRHWTRADWGGVHMKHAKKLLDLGYKLEEIQGCALAMVKNPSLFNDWLPEWKLQYLSTLLRGEPPYIEQWLKPPDPPPIYETRAYDEWVQNWGKKAVRLGLWNGIYAPINQPHRLSSSALRIILGEKYVKLSLEKKVIARPPLSFTSGLRGKQKA